MYSNKEAPKNAIILNSVCVSLTLDHLISSEVSISK